MPIRRASPERDAPAHGSPGKGSSWDWVFAPRRKDERRYWVVKSEPGTFSFDDLLAAPGRTTHWDGVRNYTARNFLREGMRLGDQVFFYHSSTTPSAIIGTCDVVREGYPDHTALDRNDPHFDPASKPDDPTWFMVDLRAVAKLPRPVTLPEMKARMELARMALIRIGRLSVTPVTPDEWDVIMRMANG
ncbi:MAG TPA: EVE domain-containing protein [Gemmatimonadaceae bacterium]